MADIACRARASVAARRLVGGAVGVVGEGAVGTGSDESRFLIEGKALGRLAAGRAAAAAAAAIADTGLGLAAEAAVLGIGGLTVPAGRVVFVAEVALPAADMTGFLSTSPGLSDSTVSSRFLFTDARLSANLFTLRLESTHLQ